MPTKGLGFDILRQQEKEKKGKTFMDYAPGHVGDDNYVTTQPTIIPNTNTNTTKANKSGKTNTATIVKESKREPFSWTDDDFLEGWNSVYNTEPEKSTVDDLRQTRERLQNMTRGNNLNFGGSYQWAKKSPGVLPKTQIGTKGKEWDDRLFLEGFYEVDGARTDWEREARMEQVDEALKEIEERNRKTTQGFDALKIEKLLGNPNAPTQITNFPHLQNGNRHPEYTNYVNTANTFFVDPQFANTLYPETQTGYYNESIPQKNYYTKDKSIYGEHTDEALDTISNILTATSLIPGIDTLADAAAIPVDLLRGDYISAGLDAFGILPFVGEVADTAKLARAGINIADAAHDANKLNITHRLTKSSKEMEKLINDIKNNGIKETIKYVEYNGEKFVVDGHHRLHIARLLGLKNIPVEKVNLPYKGYNSINDLFWE